MTDFSLLKDKSPNETNPVSKSYITVWLLLVTCKPFTSTSNVASLYKPLIFLKYVFASPTGRNSSPVNDTRSPCSKLNSSRSSPSETAQYKRNKRSNAYQYQSTSRVDLHCPPVKYESADHQTRWQSRPVPFLPCPYPCSSDLCAEMKTPRHH